MPSKLTTDIFFTPRLNFSHRFKWTWGISMTGKARSRTEWVGAQGRVGVGAGPPRTTPRAQGITVAIHIVGRRRRPRPRTLATHPKNL